jgi:hypothetical protein
MEKGYANRTGTFDYAGIFLSSLCAVHCMVTPFLLALLPSFGKQLQSPWVHFVLLVFIGVIFLKTILTHYKMHKSHLTLWIGISGLAVLTFAFIHELFIGEPCGATCVHHGHDPTGMYISITGGILLIIAHILNLRACVCFRKGGVCGSKN